MKMELIQKNFNADHWGDMPMLSDLQLVYMVPRNSTQMLNINTTKFQVDREPVYITPGAHPGFGGGANHFFPEHYIC